MAIDGSGNVWATNRGGNGSLSELNSAGGAVSGTSGYTGGGLNNPYGIAIDGAGNVWAANNGGDATASVNSVQQEPRSAAQTDT